MKTVLFLCTGNYYRSRFAELLFNELAQRNGTSWRAISSGIARKITELRNPGAISHNALAALADLKIFPPEPIRFPRKATYEELSAADFIIALSEKEHKLMFGENYPEFDGELEFWEIGDVDIESAKDALQRLRNNVTELVESLNGNR